MAKNKHLGTSLDDFLAEEGLAEEVSALAQKRLIAFELRQAMTEAGLSEAALARRMNTSRTVVRSLLDPSSESATLVTLTRAALAVGRRLDIRLAPRRKRTQHVRRKTVAKRGVR